MKEENKGINHLARTLSRRMNKQSESPPIVDLGTIKKNGSLVAHTFPETIAQSDYSILEGIDDLQENDRVLVVWVDSEPVIIGKLKSDS